MAMDPPIDTGLPLGELTEAHGRNAPLAVCALSAAASLFFYVACEVIEGRLCHDWLEAEALR